MLNADAIIEILFADSDEPLARRLKARDLDQKEFEAAAADPSVQDAIRNHVRQYSLIQLPAVLRTVLRRAAGAHPEAVRALIALLGEKSPLAARNEHDASGLSDDALRNEAGATIRQLVEVIGKEEFAKLSKEILDEDSEGADPALVSDRGGSSGGDGVHDDLAGSVDGSPVGD